MTDLITYVLEAELTDESPRIADLVAAAATGAAIKTTNPNSKDLNHRVTRSYAELKQIKKFGAENPHSI